MEKFCKMKLKRDIAFNIASQFFKRKDYGGMVRAVKCVPDLRERQQLCFSLLACIGMVRAVDEYGSIVIIDDREKYERARSGLENVPPEIVFFKDGRDCLHDPERLTDFVPEDNPLKKYWRGIEGL